MTKRSPSLSKTFGLGLLVVIAVVVAYAATSLVPSVTDLSTYTGPSQGDLVATFSIVGFDPDTGDLGVAVQSKFFAVGAVVPFAEAGVGAIATQSLANTTYGPRGLDMLRNGTGVRPTLEALLENDPQRSLRQVGVINAAGEATQFTGDGCLTWAGGRIGINYAVQGNILAGPEVVDAMAAAFEDTGGDLANRLVAALEAGQAAGGDVRGRQSAAVLVVREGAGYGGFNDRFVDLRVDDHETPIMELRRLLDIRSAQLFGEQGTRSLQAANTATALDRRLLLQQAIADFNDATRLDPSNGWHWMSLATAQLSNGDLEAAAASGVHALEADPWVKTGILRGFGSLQVAERLLEDDSFRAAWELIPVEYR